MNLYFNDEYGELIYHRTGGTPPSPGSVVDIDDEEWNVKSLTFYPQKDTVVIVITQTISRPATVDNTTGARLNEMHNAIIALTKQQDDLSKKNRALHEQVSSVSKRVNQKIQKDT